MHLVIDGRCMHAHMGGIGVVTKHLLERWGQNPRGHRLTALIGAHPPTNLVLPGINTCQVSGQMIDERFELIELPDILTDLQADVYLNPTFSVPALKTTSAQISIVHDVVFEERPEWVESPLGEYLRRATRFSAAHADRIITVSNYSRERICSLYGVNPDRVIRIHNGLPAEACDLPSDESIRETCNQFALDRPYMLFLSTIELKKGIRELLRAFVQYCNTGAPGNLVLVGGQGGPAFDLTTAIHETGCANRIHFLGYVEERQKKPLLAGADLLVYPSLYEGFGMPPLEALALGIPALVHSGTSLPEVVGDVGMQVDVTNVGAFADALQAGMSDPSFRAQARERGPARVQSHFNRDHLADQYLDVCETAFAAVV